MSDKHVKMASFVTRTMDIAVPVLSQIRMIAIIIYTSRAKLAQFYAKFSEAAHITLANASHLSGRTATETTRPGWVRRPDSGVTHSDSQDSEYTLGSDSSDGLPLTAAAGLGGSIVSAAVGHSIARAENEYAAAMSGV
ncbi:hypothetical protein D8L93_01700 [Sodalis-like symbiont of Bactericera trigonica]|nr:hypothetical protein D8L93_01700 [Sodalis-like symbiont of Bactericera trigonica]